MSFVTYFIFIVPIIVKVKSQGIERLPRSMENMLKAGFETGMTTNNIDYLLVYNHV